MSNRKYRNREEWQAIIEQQEQSGLGVPEFCKQSGLTPKYFYRKRSQLRNAKAMVRSDSCFVQLSPQPVSTAANGLELQYRDSRLQLLPTVSPIWLAQLLNSL